MRSLLFKSMLRQDIGWFDDLRNNTAALTNRLSYDTSEVQGVREGEIVVSLPLLSNCVYCTYESDVYRIL